MISLIVQKMQLLPRVVITTPLLILSNCVTPTQDLPDGQNSAPSAESNAHWNACKWLGGPLPIPYKVLNAQLAWQGRQPQLIYQAAFRDTMRTLLQPLDSSYQMKGDAIVLGVRGEPYVTNFVSERDVKGASWSWFRYKEKGSERFKAAVEWVAPGTAVLKQVIVPLPQDQSAQQIWTFPLRQAAHAVVVIRSNPIYAKDGTESSFYHWFSVNMQNASSKMVSTSQLDSVYSSVTFELMEPIQEPVAVVLKNTGKLGEQDAQSKNHYQVVMKRLFTTQKEEIGIQDLPGPASELMAKYVPSSSLTAIAWLQEPTSSHSQQSIGWIFVPFNESIFRNEVRGKQKTKKVVTQYKRLQSTPVTTKGVGSGTHALSYFPGDVDLHWSTSEKKLLLRWTLVHESGDIGSLSLPLSPLSQSSVPVGVYPPMQGGKLVGTTFSATKLQKNVMILADESKNLLQNKTSSVVRLCEF